MLKRIISPFIVFTLFVTVLPTPAAAHEFLEKEVDTYHFTVFDKDVNKNVDVAVKMSTNNSKKQFTYQYWLDGEYDSTVFVDLENDYAYMDNGLIKEEYTISETVTFEKVLSDSTKSQQNTDNTFTSISLPTDINNLVLNNNYLNSEPLEIDSSGTQIPLGTSVYSGYEAVGYLSFTNPVESGYLQRKASGYTVFEAYNYTISAGTYFGTAVSIIVSIAASAGAGIAAAVISSLLSGMIGAGVGSIIDTYLVGELRCREYRWDYRVRHNSNTGTLLKTAVKYRYWWELYDQQGRRSFEERTNVVNGWTLSNHELIISALGR